VKCEWPANKRRGISFSIVRMINVNAPIDNDTRLNANDLNNSNYNSVSTINYLVLSSRQNLRLSFGLLQIIAITANNVKQ